MHICIEMENYITKITSISPVVINRTCRIGDISPLLVLYTTCNGIFVTNPEQPEYYYLALQEYRIDVIKTFVIVITFSAEFDSLSRFTKFA